MKKRQNKKIVGITHTHARVYIYWDTLDHSLPHTKSIENSVGRVMYVQQRVGKPFSIRSSDIKIERRALCMWLRIIRHRRERVVFYAPPYKRSPLESLTMGHSFFLSLEDSKRVCKVLSNGNCVSSAYTHTCLEKFYIVYETLVNY